VAVVTGAAGGIGRATSQALAEAGCHLALVDRDEAGLAVASKELAGARRRVTSHAADVADRARMEALAADVVAEHGAVHVLVNNAGVTVARSFEEHSLEDLDWIVGINFWGVVHGCRFFLPHLRVVDEGHIVNISSMAAFVGMPTQSSYCATKAAVQSLSESLYAELSGTAIGVTCVHPGTIRTNLLRSSRHGQFERAERVERLVRGMDRWGRPPEVVARRIVRAIERRRPRVVIGAEARVTDWLKRLAPGLPSRLLALGYRRGAAGKAD
jgi:short-subunit dehydrogenase